MTYILWCMDLNADVAESYRPILVGDDHRVIPLVTSASMACGFHGGDPLTITEACQIARKHNVSIGAHPSYNDREGFGRRYLQKDPDELKAELQFQLGGLNAIVTAQGSKLRYVKAHGALYNELYTNEVLAKTLIQTLISFDSHACLLGQPGGALEELASKFGIQFFKEGFADRRYRNDGSLVPRSSTHALIKSTEKQLAQAVALATTGIVIDESGHAIKVGVDSICVHGDSPESVSILSQIRSEFGRLRIPLRPFC